MDKIIDVRDSVSTPPWLHVNDIKKVIYFESTKTCSSSIRILFGEYVNLLAGPVNHSERFKKTSDWHLENIYDEKKFESYFKFGFCRNPFSKAVSCFRHYTNYSFWKVFQKETGIDYNDHDVMKNYKIPDLSFSDFLFNITNDMWRSYNWEKQINFLPPYINFDFIGKFENIEKDWKHVADKIGLGKLEVSNFFGSYNYKDYYTDKEIELVETYYKKDFETFGYETWKN